MSGGEEKPAEKVMTWREQIACLSKELAHDAARPGAVAGGPGDRGAPLGRISPARLGSPASWPRVSMQDTRVEC